MTYCTLEDIASIISEKDLINLTNDLTMRLYPKPLDPHQPINPVHNNGYNVISDAEVVSPQVNPDVFDQVAADADSFINGYLRARYKLPLNTIPAFIRTIATDICAYRLYSRRSQKIPEHIVTNYTEAIASLKEIQKGNILLETGSEDSAMSNLKTEFRCSKKPQDKIFNDRMMKMFRGWR